MSCMESEHDEPLFTFLLGLSLPKLGQKKISSWKRYYGKIEFLGHNNVQNIWRQKDQGFLPKKTVPTLKHGDWSMMFTGSFDSWKTGQLIAIRGIMKSEDYIQVLDENLLQSAQNRRFSFQQDNNPKYTSKSVTVWLQKKEHYSFVIIVFNQF